ncbi:MAG: hypothetical protein QME42_00950 [bacterium]|nr:hypothetical protein [bacterium]
MKKTYKTPQIVTEEAFTATAAYCCKAGTNLPQCKKKSYPKT